MHGPASWPCKELAAAGLTHTDHPEDADHSALFHPKSFAAHFPFNTNIWAAKDRRQQPIWQDMARNGEFFPYYYRASEQWFPASATSDQHAHGLPWVSDSRDCHCLCSRLLVHKQLECCQMTDCNLGGQHAQHCCKAGSKYRARTCTRVLWRYDSN
jgi:hypothetical protein